MDNSDGWTTVRICIAIDAYTAEQYNRGSEHSAISFDGFRQRALAGKQERLNHGEDESENAFRSPVVSIDRR